VPRQEEISGAATKYRRVTDRQTDGQTSCHGIVRAMHTRRAVKIYNTLHFKTNMTYSYNRVKIDRQKPQNGRSKRVEKQE